MRDEMALLIDMVEHGRSLRSRLVTLSRADYDRDVLLRYGIAHALQIIGEAAAKVSAPTRAKYDALPWKQIVGMRNRLVHEYWRIDPDIVWDTATVSIVEMLRTLESDIGPLIDSASRDEDKP